MAKKDAPKEAKTEAAAAVLNDDGTPATTPEQAAENRAAMDAGFLHASSSRTDLHVSNSPEDTHGG